MVNGHIGTMSRGAMHAFKGKDMVGAEGILTG
jgi:hypothetical protein